MPESDEKPGTTEKIEINLLTPDYKPQLNWIIGLIQMIKPNHILELGTDVGDSTRIFLAATHKTNCKITTVDVKNVDKKWAEGESRVEFIESDTRVLKWKEQIDILFVDDHVEELDIYAHVIGELEHFGVWVRKGGAILIHDTDHGVYGEGIRRAIRTWCKQRELRWMEDPAGYGMAIIEVDKNLVH